MQETDIFNDLKEVIALVKPNMDLANVTMESDLFTELGMDSLMMMLVALAIENKFKIQMDSGLQFRKVSDVVTYISSKLPDEK